MDLEKIKQWSEFLGLLLKLFSLIFVMGFAVGALIVLLGGGREIASYSIILTWVIETIFIIWLIFRLNK